MASDAELQKLLSEVCTYYKHAPTDMEADLWLLVIREFGPGAVKRALTEHLGRSAFMPKVGEIRTALGASAANTGLQAFEIVRHQVERVGPYLSPSFEDPAIGLAIREMGGWEYINEAMPCPDLRRHDYEAFSRRFQVAYDTARVRLNRGEAERVEVRGIHRLTRDAQSAATELLSHETSRPRIQG